MIWISVKYVGSASNWNWSGRMIKKNTEWELLIYFHLNVAYSQTGTGRQKRLKKKKKDQRKANDLFSHEVEAYSKWNCLQSYEHMWAYE